MRKTVMFLSLFLSFFHSALYAATTYVSESGRTNCSEDAVIDDTSGKKWIVSTINLTAPTSGSFICEEHGYWGGTWSSWRVKNTSYNCPANGYASLMECRNGVTLVSCTADGNGWTEYRTYCKTVDDMAPTLANLSFSVADNVYIPADSARNIQISVDSSGGAPIQSIEARMESHITPAIFATTVTQNNTNTFSSNFNLSLVDGADKLINNYRPYTFQVQQICDEAANCIAGVPYDYTYNVYANNVHIGASTINIPSNLTSGTAVADGSQKVYNLTLNDIYGNNIIPVRRADNSILRSVSLIFNHTLHNLRINQYNLATTQGAVEFEYNSAAEQPDIGDPSTTFSTSNVANTSGIYTPSLRVYAPTQNQDPKAYGDFTLDNLQVNLSDSVTTPLDPVSKSLRFNSLYEILFSGDLRTQGFIEGTLQNSTTQITKNSLQTVTNPRLYLEFGSGGLKAPSPSFQLEYGKTPSMGEFAIEGQQSNISLLAPAYHSLVGDQSLNLHTLLGQTAASSPSKSYLSSHIQYLIGSKVVSYNSDVISKNNYHDTTITGNSTVIQKGVKVLGLVSSDKTQEIVANQFSDDIRIIGKVVKSSFRKDISKRIFESLRSIPVWPVLPGRDPEVGDFSESKWKDTSLNTGLRTLDDSVQVFKSIDGKYVSLGDGGGSTTISGIKTIVTIGGDIYIRENITALTVDDMLGIIALRDASGNGGNIYVHPSVTDIHAIIYADKSLMSASDTNANGIIDISEVHGPATPIATLANQFYLKGSLFSENSIGGSRSAPIQCPYYIDCVTSGEAQKYDLNYIRRYARIDTNSDGIPDAIANGGDDANGGTTNYPDYPVIIEYNPSIQTNPPPFFN